ncbi:hypothetical protein KCP73_15070 [Salmonella enterica subsp. enterica]|nr:hypothetical protein KCP73_15070 [Salmonella enterica subsp. enterica]
MHPWPRPPVCSAGLEYGNYVRQLSESFHSDYREWRRHQPHKARAVLDYTGRMLMIGRAAQEDHGSFGEIPALSGHWGLSTHARCR